MECSSESGTPEIPIEIGGRLIRHVPIVIFIAVIFHAYSGNVYTNRPHRYARSAPHRVCKGAGIGMCCDARMAWSDSRAAGVKTCVTPFCLLYPFFLLVCTRHGHTNNQTKFFASVYVRIFSISSLQHYIYTAGNLAIPRLYSHFTLTLYTGNVSPEGAADVERHRLRKRKETCPTRATKFNVTLIPAVPSLNPRAMTMSKLPKDQASIINRSD